MKRILFVLLFFIVASSMVAQVVMGIDIKTTMKVFNLKMGKKGYKPVVSALGKYEYIVNFAGYPNCRYVVRYNTETDSIGWATIYFHHISQNKDEEIYNNIKTQLIAKYGTPDYDTDVNYRDRPRLRAALGYKGASFNTNNPFLCWHFDEEQNVSIEYHTNVSMEVLKTTYSPDL